MLQNDLAERISEKAKWFQPQWAFFSTETAQTDCLHLIFFTYNPQKKKNIAKNIMTELKVGVCT